VYASLCIHSFYIAIWCQIIHDGKWRAHATGSSIFFFSHSTCIGVLTHCTNGKCGGVITFSNFYSMILPHPVLYKWSQYILRQRILLHGISIYLSFRGGAVHSPRSRCKLVHWCGDAQYGREGHGSSYAVWCGQFIPWRGITWRGTNCPYGSCNGFCPSQLVFWKFKLCCSICHTCPPPSNAMHNQNEKGYGSYTFPPLVWSDVYSYSFNRYCRV
jgi:hypothetical protein